tara:strand:- start:774 stop:2045 length:1272 start_codon:yes stop_codon:yes gene_type:complete
MRLTENEVNKEIKRILNDFEKDFDKTSNYTDLTYLKTYCIDDFGTFEVDDAISLEKINNSFRIWIHIASPSDLLKLGSLLDQEASDQGRTLYFLETVKPMLPKILVDRCFSLRSRFKSKALSVSATLNNDGSLKAFEVTRSIIKPDYCINYEDADELIELNHPNEDLTKIHELMNLRREWRKSEGAIILDETIGKFYLRNNIVDIKYVYPTNSRRLISECMILMGNIVAKYALNNKISVPYRSMSSSNTYYDTKKYSMNPTLNNNLVKQKFSKAVISTRPQRHSNLGLDVYLHVTSPIRRYIDIVSHRQILFHLDNLQTLPEEYVSNAIHNYEKNNRICNEIENSKKIITITSWLNDNLKVLESYFIKVVMKRLKIVIIYIPAIEMTVSCLLNDIDNLSFGDKVKLRFLGLNHNLNQLEFFKL